MTDIGVYFLYQVENEIILSEKGELSQHQKAKIGCEEQSGEQTRQDCNDQFITHLDLLSISDLPHIDIK